VSAAEVFNAVGNTNFGYHSYPIVWLSVEDTIHTPVEGFGAGWYIFETTIDFNPATPKKLNGSKYWCEGGLQNWLYSGVVRKNDSSQFNGIKMPVRAGSSGKKINNSLKKRRDIIKYWKDGECFD